MIPMGESSCVQCGECTQICPVGALTNKKSIGKARVWEVKKDQDNLPLLRGRVSTMALHLKEGRIVNVSGVEEAEPPTMVVSV